MSLPLDDASRLNRMGNHIGCMPHGALCCTADWSLTPPIGCASPPLFQQDTAMNTSIIAIEIRPGEGGIDARQLAARLADVYRTWGRRRGL